MGVLDELFDPVPVAEFPPVDSRKEVPHGGATAAPAVVERRPTTEAAPAPTPPVTGAGARASAVAPPDAGREAYVALKAMNWSTLKHMARSPKMFKWRLEHPEPPKAAYDFGRAFHCALLEPAVFAERYVVAPDFGDLRTKAGRARRDAWNEESALLKRESISADDLTTITRMAEEVRAHRVGGQLLDGVLAEQTITWTDEVTGVKCKARLDMLGKDFLADVKTSRDPVAHAFRRDAAQHLYHGQLAMYFDGAIAAGLLPKHCDPPYIIVPEKEEPHDVVVYRMHRNLALDVGRALYRGLLRRWLECESAGWFPGMAPELTTLELPVWAPGSDEPAPDSDFE